MSTEQTISRLERLLLTFNEDLRRFEQELPAAKSELAERIESQFAALKTEHKESGHQALIQQCITLRLEFAALMKNYEAENARLAKFADQFPEEKVTLQRELAERAEKVATTLAEANQLAERMAIDERMAAIRSEVAELSAKQFAELSTERDAQLVKLREEQAAIAAQHLAAVMAERQKIVSLDELRFTLANFAAKAAEKAVKEFSDKSAEGTAELVKRELSAMPAPAAPSLADRYVGLWDKGTLYKRGEVFTLRGSTYLVLRDALGILPSATVQKGPEAYYAVIAAAGAPGSNAGGTSGGGAALPDQAGNAGKFLSTDGANPLWSTPAGSGDVVGPASAVTARIATFNGATGKLIQDGGKTIAVVLSDAATDAQTRADTAQAAAIAAAASDATTKANAAQAASQPLATVLTNTTAAFTTAQETKLAGIEAGADVTDTANVAAAGAVMSGGLGAGVAAALAAALDGASGLASKAYADALVTGLLDFKGNTDASANPNYPAASKGDVYYISVAGKVGGASGKSVDVGDAVVASADNAGGTEASVGTSWFVLEHNLTGALLSANNLSDLASASTARTNLELGALATLTPGTGVAAALVVNVGTAGAPVVNGGAGGTPSSLTLTNATALPLSGLAQSSATSGQVPTWNGSAWAAATPASSSGASKGLLVATNFTCLPV
jgi:hypothetical protein